MREPPNISVELLRSGLRDQYDLEAVTLEFLPLGLDSRAGVYRVVSAQGERYLLKARSGSLYEPSCLVPRYLHDHEIAAVVAPLPTTQGALWAKVGVKGELSLILYPFIEGDSGWRPDLTDAQWQAVGMALKQIHQVTPPSEGFPLLRKETFATSEYGSSVRTLGAHIRRTDGGSQSERSMRACWMEHQSTIHTALTTMETLAGALRQRSGPQVICHADLHPGNIIRGHANRVFVIDWDDVMLAPKERDFLFVGEPQAGELAHEGAPPFFQGYGPTTIDWAALTYYRFERVVQDVIECGRIVFLSDDVGEAARAGEADLFCAIFAPDGEIVAAWAAAAHLPSGAAERTSTTD